MRYKEKISGEELQKLPVKAFEGPIQLVASSEEIKEAVDYLAQQPYIGFDTETRPAFKKGQKYQVALLQLASEEKAFVFFLQKIEDFEQISALLCNKKVTKIGAATRDDIKTLNKLFPVNSSSFIDLQNIIENYGIKELSLKKMAALTLNFRISKTQRISNWEADPLSEQQLVYAATDAWVSLMIYLQLLTSSRK